MKIRRIDQKHLSQPLNAADEIKNKDKKALQRNSDKQEISQWDSVKIHSKLDQKIKQCKEDDSFEVIVQLTSNLKSDHKKLKRILGPSFTPKHVFKYIDAFSADLTAKQIKQLSQHQEVKMIEENETLFANLETANEWFGTE